RPRAGSSRTPTRWRTGSASTNRAGRRRCRSLRCRETGSGGTHAGPLIRLRLRAGPGPSRDSTQQATDGAIVLHPVPRAQRTVTDGDRERRLGQRAEQLLVRAVVADRDERRALVQIRLHALRDDGLADAAQAYLR